MSLPLAADAVVPGGDTKGGKGGGGESEECLTANPIERITRRRTTTKTTKIGWALMTTTCFSCPATKTERSYPHPHPLLRKTATDTKLMTPTCRDTRLMVSACKSFVQFPLYQIQRSRHRHQKASGARASEACTSTCTPGPGPNPATLQPASSANW